MKYLMQIFGNHTREEFEAFNEDERKALYEAWGAVNRAPGVTPGMELAAPSTATTVRVKDGQTITTDGPFAETKEALAGYFLLDAEDLDAAIELASRVPPASSGGAVEVRPIVER